MSQISPVNKALSITFCLALGAMLVLGLIGRHLNVQKRTTYCHFQAEGFVEYVACKEWYNDTRDVEWEDDKGVES